MTPIFGKGVVFDAPPERRAEMLKNSSLRGPQMKGHAEVIAAEVERSGRGLGRRADDRPARLLRRADDLHVVGLPDRQEVPRAARRPRSRELYHDLERGTDALAYVDPYAPIESFRRRDEARVELVKLVEGIMAGRAAGGAIAGDNDLLDVLMSVKEDDKPRFTADEITGMFISMMFAGHHTTSGTAAWTLIELLRNPDEMAAVVAELDELYADGSEVSFQALREIPRLEAAIKEALRLHPPLILLLRVATAGLEVGGYHDPQGRPGRGEPGGLQPAAPDFPDADAFDPARYLDPRREDDRNPWTWIPFGGGRHRCVGAAFAMMQLKAIFSVLLRDYTFELAQPSDTYRNDHSKMVVQLEQPCAVTRPAADGAREDHRRPRPVPGPRDVRGRGARGVRGQPRRTRSTVLTDPSPPETTKRCALAVKYCPTRALSIEED